MLKAVNKLGLVFFPAFDWAISPTHPEREERLLYTLDQVQEEGVADIEGVRFYNPSVAEKKDIERVHFCVPDISSLVTESHMVSAGGAITAARAVMEGEVRKAFAVVRPPGHHAHRVIYGDRGFCIINVEAVMLEYVRRTYGPRRVVIVDTDCHHGDGTQDIYWNDRDTLFISIHQDGRTLYPGTGFPEEFGGPGAFGYTINIPLPPQTGEEGFLYVIENLVLPIIKDYSPDLIVNSAGQDNHYTDPITNMNFTAQGYAKMTQRLNPDIAVLEGGYSIEGALPYVNLGIILALAGLDYSHVKEPDYDPEKIRQPDWIAEYLKRLCEEIYRRWVSKEDAAKKMFEGKDRVVRKKRIYYDTIAVMEEQEETIKVCPACSGLITIKSECDLGYSILAVTIPRDACARCIDEGHRAYRTADPGDYSGIYLQDKVNDEYCAKI
ncbi:histone deacetylase family protein [Thermosediminibacter litoriperuensis]|uniref:Acetoin utilization deacetylase AcuC-like enzyme n=1 Tax=Thermosediminibacter litoriperuensis TaxID=291989 RepID=A0A5S5AVY9_9FIRM|nr:histone deacetylase [Thermosediminibacter litoriperuensis]TYP56697.1 acetoin utilization deacetylase AcuC-like enzyme [Thermosediminibacter litoriperuensis]